MWEPRRLTTLWASTASYRDSFTISFLQKFPIVEAEVLTVIVMKTYILLFVCYCIARNILFLATNIGIAGPAILLSSLTVPLRYSR
jgi:hypothetical protein